MNIERALQDERLLKAVVGMGRNDFLSYWNTFSPFVKKIRYKRTRKRKAGGEENIHWKHHNKIFLYAFYMKCYPTFDVAEFFFEADKSQAKRWVDDLRVALEKTLGKAMMLPARKVRSVKEFLERFSEVKQLLGDGTERPVHRPKNKQKQKRTLQREK